MNPSRIWPLSLALAIAACGGAPDSRPVAPSAPTPLATSPAPAVTGTVWLHAPDGVRPYANVPVGGWVYSSNGGGSWVWGTVDATGHYRLPAAESARVRLQVAGGVGVYQPCAVTIAAGDRPGRDVTVITDTAQLGAQLPAALREQGLTLSGVVYEIGADGRRTPVEQARLTFETADGFLAAWTLSDAEGRYILCGLGGESIASVYASKTGYVLHEQGARLSGNTVLDIQMRR